MILIHELGPVAYAALAPTWHGPRRSAKWHR